LKLKINKKTTIHTNHTAQLIMTILSLSLVGYFVILHIDIFSQFRNLNILTNRLRLLTIVIFIALVLGQTYMVLLIISKNKEIEKLAFCDKATNLYNKAYFIRLLEEEFKSNKNDKKAIILINCGTIELMKQFFEGKMVDQLLLEKANALKKLNIDERNLFRYSEDSFLVYITGYHNEDSLRKIGDKILALLDNTTHKMDCDAFIARRLGILEMGENYKNVDDIIKHLEITINKIQDLESDKHWFFSDEIQKEILFDKLVEKELRKAAHVGFDEEFYLEYQPLVESKSNKIIGLEALARWNNKELGMVQPHKFIEIAERTQLIIPFGEWVIFKALEFLKQLESVGLNHIYLAINISAIQLLQDDFIDYLANAVERKMIEPQKIELEITESKFMYNYEENNRKLDLLRGLGITIALDDFGTGYSSLARLRNLNIDVLKVDRIFIENIINPYEEDVFVKSIIILANQLNLKVVAEGVETEEQKQYLLSENCHVMQGYLFSRPISAEKAISLIKKNNPRAS